MLIVLKISGFALGWLEFFSLKSSFRFLSLEWVVGNFFLLKLILKKARLRKKTLKNSPGESGKLIHLQGN